MFLVTRDTKELTSFSKNRNENRALPCRELPPDLRIVCL